MNNEFTEEEFAFYSELLEKFPGEKRIKSITDADVICPAHDDSRPSLGVDLRRNGLGPKIVLKCRSQGCEYDAILEAAELSNADLHFNSNGSAPNGSSASKRPKLEGCSLEAYAASKNLPVEFLTGDEVGLEQTTYAGVAAVYIPYADTAGEIIAERFRVGLNKSKNDADNRFRWEKGNKPALYGLHRLEEARKAGYVLLVEGESDCHVAWYHGLPAVGVPGIETWKAKWAEHLDGIKTVLVAVEPDEAGEMLWFKIVASAALSSRLVKVRFSDAI